MPGWLDAHCREVQEQGLVKTTQSRGPTRCSASKAISCFQGLEMTCIQREDGTNRENHVGNCCLFSLFVSTQRHNWYESIYSESAWPPAEGWLGNGLGWRQSCVERCSQQLQENPSVSSNVAGREIPDMQVLMGKLSMNGDFRLRFPEGMCPTCLYNRNINEQQIWMHAVGFSRPLSRGSIWRFHLQNSMSRKLFIVCWRLRFSIPIPIPGGSLKLSEPTSLIQRLRRQKDGGRSNSGLCEELAHGLLGYLHLSPSAGGIQKWDVSVIRRFYPLVICCIAIENGHWNGEFSN